MCIPRSCDYNVNVRHVQPPLITDSLTKFYIALEVQLIVMLTLQAIAYPYRRRWHNIIDVLLFANLAVINAMTMYNYKIAKDRSNDTRAINAVSAIQTILVSTPFVCMVCIIHHINLH